MESVEVFAAREIYAARNFRIQAAAHDPVSPVLYRCGLIQSYTIGCYGDGRNPVGLDSTNPIWSETNGIARVLLGLRPPNPIGFAHPL